MKVCIHRGAHQIGGSCVELESQGKRLVLDLGLPLDAEEAAADHLPPILGLRETDETLLGILISHPHQDHYGLLGHVRPGLPVAMGTSARRILQAAAPWVPKAVSIPEGPALEDGKTWSWGPFQITPFLVDHSAFDAYALLVEADGQRLFYSGDFRAHGRKGRLFERLLADPPKDIDALLMEGSSLGRLDLDSTFETETELEERFVQEFRGTRGMALVYASAQNIDRIVTLFRAAKRTDRRLAIDLYTASILEATGKETIPQSHWNEVVLYIPQRQRVQIKNQGWFDDLKRHSLHRIYPEALGRQQRELVMLVRSIHLADRAVQMATRGARFFYSAWEGYLDTKSGAQMKAWSERHGIPFQSLHTSGHAGPADLRRFVETVQPKALVPIHSFHPERYEALYPGVKIHEDGVWWEVEACIDSPRVV